MSNQHQPDARPESPEEEEDRRLTAARFEEARQRALERLAAKDPAHQQSRSLERLARAIRRLAKA